MLVVVGGVIEGGAAHLWWREKESGVVRVGTSPVMSLMMSSTYPPEQVGGSLEAALQLISQSPAGLHTDWLVWGRERVSEARARGKDLLLFECVSRPGEMWRAFSSYLEQVMGEGWRRSKEEAATLWAPHLIGPVAEAGAGPWGGGTSLRA